MVSKLIWPTRTNSDREIQGFRRGQNDDNFDKANKVTGDVEDNIPTLDDTGDLKDSGYSFDDVKLKKSSTETVINDYSIIDTDEIIWVDASDSDIQITLLSPVDITGQTFQIQKIDNSVNIVSVVCEGFLINGETSIALNRQRDYIKPTSNGEEYLI